MQNKVILFFILGILLFVLFFKSNDPFDCPPYVPLEEYTIANEQYQFCKNPNEYSFAVIDKGCQFQKNDVSEQIFEMYFVGQYASVIEKAPSDITKIEDATNNIIQLIEKPFDKVESEKIKELTFKLKTFFIKVPYVTDPYAINAISKEYNILYSIINNALDDDYLTVEEINNIKYQTSKFIYTYLDKTNQIQNYITEVVDSGFVVNLFKVDKWLRLFKPYNEWREEQIIEQIEKTMFDIPIEFIYKNLNK